jgi:hypothetical protein
MMIGAGCTGIAFAAPQIPLANAPAQPAAQKSAATHERTMIAVTRAVDTGTAAAEASCKPDKAVQTRTRTAADAAQKELIAAAEAEADEAPDVSQARYALIGATYSMKGDHPPAEMEKLKSDADARLEAYTTLKDAKTKAIIDAAFSTLSPPDKPPACPPPQQRAANPPTPTIPPLPATPEKGVAMLRNFNEAQFKAILAQPELRIRVETLMGLEGCNWSVNAAASSQPVSRQAATFLGRMDDNDLRETLTSVTVQGRIDAAFGVGSCGATPPGNTLSFPEAQQRDPGPAYAPDGFPNDNSRRRGAPSAVVPGVPGVGTPYGYGYPYGGYYGGGYRYGYPYGR